MRKTFIVPMLIAFAMICSCQKQDSAAEQQLAQRKTELDAREEALIEREKVAEAREKGLNEREKALAQNKKATANAQSFRRNHGSKRRLLVRSPHAGGGQLNALWLGTYFVVASKRGSIGC